MAKKRRGRRHVRWGRVFFAFFLFCVLIVSAVVASAYYYIDYRSKHDENVYIAIIGVDGRIEDQVGQRSDTTMLVKVSYKTSTVEMISLPRDSLVSIPCEDGENDKITHAFHYGGKQCVIESLEGVFEIKEIKNYVVVNFNKLISLVDELGGITLRPSKTFCEYNVKKTEQYCFEKGVKTELNGEYALAYARHRKSDNDIYRTQRQQEILMAMVTRVKTLEPWDVYKFSQKVLAELDTNITLLDAVIDYKMATNEEFKLVKTQAEGSDYYYEGVYYYKLDKEWLNGIIDRIKE